TPTTTANPEEEVVALSPFQVVASNNGYYAANTMSGTRFNTKLDDLASSITVVTKGQMEDFAMLDINDIFLYTANTEGTGTYTDYTLDRNGSVQDNVQTNPTQANRVRGIAPANISLNNIETMGRTPIDPILLDGIEVSRGPNANVFGLGNPSGTVNQVMAAANLSRNRTQAQFRIDSYGGYRSSIDVNRVLLKGRLAGRVSAVYQEDKFDLKPSGVSTERYNGMFKYQPFKNTSISGAYFYYHMYGNRPNAIPPRDNISYWIRSGRPTWDPVTRMVNVGGTALGPFGTASAYNGPNYFTTGGVGGNSSQLYIDQTGISYWSAPQGYTSTTGPTSGTQANWLVQTTGIEGATGTAAVPSAQPLFRTTPTVSDKSVYDWSSINIASMNRIADRNSTATLQFDQIFVNTALQTFAVQGVVMREESKRDQRNIIGLANDNGQSGQLAIDVNERRLDGSVNPFFLRPFVSTDRPRTTYQPAKWDTYRGQAAYRLDLTQQENALKWLGVFNLAGYYEYKYRINRQYSYRDVMVDIKPWLPAGVYRGFQNGPSGTPTAIRLTQSLQHYYVGDTTGENVDYAPGDFTYGTYPYVWGNAATGVFQNETAELGLAAADKTGGTANSKQVLKTTGAVAQGHFLDDRLVVTYGWREDKVFSMFGNPDTHLLNGDGMTFNRAVTDTWDGAWKANKGRTTNTQVVLRPFRDLPFTKGEGFVPQLLGGMSLLYNKSDSFIPATPAQALPDDPSQPYVQHLLPNPTGEDESFGAAFNLFHDKLVIRVTRYDNKQLNSRNNDANTVAQRVIRTDLPLLGATPGRFMLYNVAGATVATSANFNRLGWIKVQNPTWTDAQVQAELVKQMKMDQAVMNALINPTPPIGATADVEAKGTEIEINYNPTTYWTVSANVTDTRSFNQNVSSNLASYIAHRMPVWTSLVDTTVAATAANPNQLWWKTLYPGASQSAETNFIAFVQSPYNVIKQLENQASPEIRRYNFRASTNLRLAGLTDHRLWKKVIVGGALRWEDKAAIGYFGVQSLPDSINDLDTDRPIYDKSHHYLDAFVQYRTTLWSDRIRATFALNVRNLGESGRLQPVAAFPDGTPHTYRIIPPQQFILTASFEM
ncbi:MAG: hypothetical protein A3G75_06455, partial [Verrucomicrobia bacterium RIFCSPLOWO2_12_FULL_64_8]